MAKTVARSLKYVWPFYNIMHERINGQICHAFAALSIRPSLMFIKYEKRVFSIFTCDPNGKYYYILPK